MSFKTSEVKVNLGKTVFTQENELTTLNYKVLELNQRISESEEKNTQLKEKINRLEQENDLLKKERNASQIKNKELYASFSNIKQEFEEYGRKIADFSNKENSLINTISIMQDEISFLNDKIRILKEENKIYKEEVEDTDRIKSKIEKSFIDVCNSLEESKNKSKTLENIVKQKDHFIDVYKKNENKYLSNKLLADRLSKELTKDCINNYNNAGTDGVFKDSENADKGNDYKLKKSNVSKSSNVNTNDYLLNNNDNREGKRILNQKDYLIEKLRNDIEKKDYLIKNLEKEKNNLFVRLKNSNNSKNSKQISKL